MKFGTMSKATGEAEEPFLLKTISQVKKKLGVLRLKS